MSMEKKITKTLKLPKGYSIESVRYVDDKIVVFLVKDTPIEGGVKRIVPIRVVQGL